MNELENTKSMLEFELGVTAQILMDAIENGEYIDSDTLAFMHHALDTWYGKYFDEIDIINTGRIN